MKQVKNLSLALVISAIAAHAMAGGFSFDLPRLMFPETQTPIVSQDCSNPASLNSEICKAN